jgi:hypothetical protein
MIVEARQSGHGEKERVTMRSSFKCRCIEEQIIRGAAPMSMERKKVMKK